MHLGGLFAAPQRPNILFIFSDDHALRAISSYGGDLKDIAPTPHIDSLAEEGALFEQSFCANSICGPSRACILTGKHSHKNGFLKNTGHGLNQNQWTLPKALQKAGYTTAIIGKWHLHTTPQGFDYWEILPGQGNYYNPSFIQMDGKRKRFEGYATHLTTQKALQWLEKRDKSRPFFLMCQHKAPHRTFSPPLAYLGSFDGVKIPEPSNLFDNYVHRSSLLAKNEMEIGRHMHWGYDLKLRKDEHKNVALPGPDGYGNGEYDRMTPEQKAIWNAYYAPLNKAFIKRYKEGKLSAKEIVSWKYQRYMRDYLSTVKAVDDSVGELLDYLKKNGLSENTIVIYSSDQGFYTGEHGWFDKRWMFEESFKMPFLMRWPGVVAAHSRPQSMIQNIDYAPTLLEAAGVSIPQSIQGISMLPALKHPKKQLRRALYYAYYEKGEHNVPQHFGVRSTRYKLFYLPEGKQWQLFDLEKDPKEMCNVAGHPLYQKVFKAMKKEFFALRKQYDAPAIEGLDKPWCRFF